jgi:hypothetical protein
MSDLRPVGVPIEIDGVERHFLFTLNVIDGLQEDYDADLSQIIKDLVEDGKTDKMLRHIVTALLEDEAERAKALRGEELERYTEQGVGWLITLENKEAFLLAVLKAYGVSIPEADEDDDPNQQGGQAKK